MQGRPTPGGATTGGRARRSIASVAITSVTTPEPTVLPPSRMANRLPGLECDRLVQAHVERGVVAGHDHLDPRRQAQFPGDAGRAEEELRLVAAEEGRVPPPSSLPST